MISGCLCGIAIGAMLATIPEPASRGALLPVQDRAGDPEAVKVLQDTLVQQLSIYDLADPGTLRDSMRALRIRDVSSTPPRLLSQLAETVGVDWFLATTVHRVVESPVPAVTLSARVFRPEEWELDWAGFESATGLDGVRAFQRGGLERIEDLLRQTIQDLMADLVVPGRSAELPRGRPRGERGGFVRRPLRPEEIGVVAVVPFDSVTDRDATLNAEILTDLTLAALHERGVRIARPALVYETLRRLGASGDRLDGMARGALQRTSRADAVLTGTVEIWDSGLGGLSPDPRIGFSVRLLDAGTGQILWIAGDEERGRDRSGVYRLGWTHAEGELAWRMLNELMNVLLVRSDGKTEEG